MKRRRHHHRRSPFRWTGVPLCVLILLVGQTTLTGTNLVPATRVGQVRATIGASSVAPSACAGLGLTAIVTAAQGSADAELQLGATGNDNLDAKAGNDCILGGGGNDNLTGGAGTDVCIGGPGNDTFDRTCETKIQ